MAGSIANLSVHLSANISQFASGMTAAIKPLKQFGSQVMSVGGLLSPLTTALAGVASTAGVVALVKSEMSAISSTTRLADRLGISTEAMSGLEYAAKRSGLSTEQLSGGLGHMLKNMAEANTEGGKAAAAFDLLGLDAAKLVNMSPDQAFQAIADGLVHITNPAQRAQAAMAIFGKSGQELLPLMLKGSAGIQAAREEAERLGLTFSRVDAAKVQMANRALSQMGEVVTGAGRTLAIQLAPYIAAAADAMTNLATGGEGMGQKVVVAFHMVLSAIATASDYLSLLMAGFYAVRGVSQACWGVQIIAIGKVIEAVEWLSNKLFGTKTNYGQLVTAMGEDVMTDMKTSFQQSGQALSDFAEGKNAKAVNQFFDQLEADANKAGKAIANAKPKPGDFIPPEDLGNLQKISEALDKLQLEANQFGMTDAEKKLAEFSSMKGVTPEQVQQYAALLGQMDQLNAAKKKQDEMNQDGKSIFDSTRTPMEKYESQIGKLHDLLDAGTIDWDTYGRAVRQAKDELEKSTKTDIASPKAPELMQAGSAAAQRFIFDSTRGMQTMTKDEVNKKHLAVAQNSDKLLERIERNTRGDSSSETEVIDIPA